MYTLYILWKYEIREKKRMNREQIFMHREKKRTHREKKSTNQEENCMLLQNIRNVSENDLHT